MSESPDITRSGNSPSKRIVSRQWALASGIASLLLFGVGGWILAYKGEVATAFAVVAAAVVCGAISYVFMYRVEFTTSRTLRQPGSDSLADSWPVQFVLEHQQAVGLGAILLLALVIRMADLGGAPANVTADETDDIQNAFRVIHGTAGGIFGLDWTPGPVMNMYIKAGLIEVFGDGIAATRMYGVILSMACLGLFYAVARQKLDPLPSLLSTLLLGTSLWFLVFSRTPWTSISASLAALATAYVLSLALTAKNNLWFYALLGVCVAFGAYAYFSSRTLVFVLGAAYLIALFLREGDFRSLTRGFVISGVVATVLFAPQMKTMVERWEYANQRTEAVSVFNVEREYLGDTGTAKILLNQTLRAVRGFILLDKSVVNYGLSARYHPEDWAFLDQVTGLVYWSGLILAALRWRKYAYWFAFLLIPLFFTQVFSTGTPDASRGLIAAPFMFLFVGVGIQELMRIATQHLRFRHIAAATVAVVIALALFNVSSYFSWVNSEQALAAREPAVEPSEYEMFLAVTKERSQQGRILSGAELDAIRNSAPPSPGEAAQPTRTPSGSAGAQDEERLRDLEKLAQALDAYHKQRGNYPSTDGNIQSACRYKAIDKLCFLEPQVGEDAFLDPRGDQQRYGYWYKSDGQTYSLFASMESPVDDDGHTCPPEGHLDAENVKNVLCLRSP